MVGLSGINTKVWRDLPHNPNNDRGNILCSGYILRVYLDECNGNYLKALTSYKGKCKLGKRQAKLVLADARK